MRQWTIDAFAAAPFRGNPACVVEPGADWPDSAWMQRLAQENNQAETAFLRVTPEPDRFGLRWFTPTIEVPLCGHATLAAAHVLFAELGFAGDRVRFDTASGELAVSGDAAGYRMDFPADPPCRIAAPAGLAEALGAEPAEVWAAGFLVALLADEVAVRALAPDIAALRRIGAEAARGPGNVGVAALAAPERAPERTYDVVSRCFAPGSGIAEDPATGSLHCILAPLFAARLGRPALRFHQAFPGRGGDLLATVAGDRVLLAGQAVTVLESRLRV